MTTGAERSVATAHRLLTKYGRAGQLWRRGEKSGPDHAPSYGDPTLLGVTYYPWVFGEDEIDGQRVLKTDQKLLISAKATDEDGAEVELTELLITDKFIEPDDAELTVVSSQRIWYNDTVVLFIVQGRR